MHRLNVHTERLGGPRCYVRQWGHISPHGMGTVANMSFVATPGDRTIEDTGALRVGNTRLALASGLTPRDAKRMDRFALLAVAAARAALADSELSPDERERCGVVVGNMTGGWTFTEPEIRKLHGMGIDYVSPYLASAWFPAAAQGQISLHLGLRGYAKTFATDRCAGGQAIGHAIERMRRSHDICLLAGGAEAPVTPFVEVAYRSKFGGHHRLAEAAAFVLLSSEPGNRLGSDSVIEIAEHWGRPRFGGDDALATQMLRWLALVQSGLSNSRLDLALVDMGPEKRLWPLLEQKVRVLLGCDTLCLDCHDGDTVDYLAASTPMAIGRACGVIDAGDAQNVLILTVGHQCLDALLIKQVRE